MRNKCCTAVLGDQNTRFLDSGSGSHLAVGGGGELHLVGNVARRHALEQLGEDAVGVLEALHKLGLALPVVALLVLPRAQLAAAEVVNEVHLHIQARH